ncbi:unnamed protein product [Mytilus coruscus]|uniref:Integrase zinc-binding domain-containing protein n=1 Tax=Mytilus coruscus TaxID=42192 RepID=A0A6J8C0P5_MYTCO|nr:unnamed protein product [Mytilus coruscus]
MDQMLEGISGTTAITDDIIIAGRNMEEHDEILKQVVEHATSHNLLTSDVSGYNLRNNDNYIPPRCRLRITEKSFLPSTVRIWNNLNPTIRNALTIPQFKRKIKSELFRPSTYYGKYEQDKSFQELKRLCSTTPVLAFFDVKKPVEIECDASQGLGAIEKEMLSIVFSTKKFHCYIFEKKTVIHNDHKPLEQIFKKPLLAAPLRIQKMMLKLQWYDIQVCYRKGKDMNTSDALSRAFLPVEHKTEEGDIVHDRICMISISKDKRPALKVETPFEVREYLESRDQLSVLDGSIYKGLRIVIPLSMVDNMLKLIYKSHLGMTKCKKRAREVMYWPRMNIEVERYIEDCALCASYQNQQPAEPLKPTPTPDLRYM